MSSGKEAINYFKCGVDLMLKADCTTTTCSSSSAKMSDKDATMATDISNAYCSMAEIHLTDLWSVSALHSDFSAMTVSKLLLFPKHCDTVKSFFQLAWKSKEAYVTVAFFGWNGYCFF